MNYFGGIMADKKIKLEEESPQHIFELKVPDEELVKKAQDLGWEKASEGNLVLSRQNNTSDFYLYYALYKGDQEGLKGDELFSFAGLITRFITGKSVYLTKNLDKEEHEIENSLSKSYQLLVDQYNTPGSNITPLTIARQILAECIEEYKHPSI